ncbi:tetratricopeptide repeat protein [Spirillospora albida]|uniref:tetratricopeptide repeat protein n=1 Tax=Spirillospora albida TaxID=58123 RepID=UPI0004C1BC2B|nr:tetratricopeptide repeat protein [Spirillospora albida]
MFDRDVRSGSFWDLLAPTDRQALRAMGRRADVPPGGTLCHQGATAPAVYVVFRARAAGNAVAKEYVGSSEGDESIIELYGAGDVVGVLGPWGHPQRATVAALEPVAALRVDGGQWRSLLAANPRVAEAMMHALAESAGHGGRRHAVRAADHPQRLAHHLLELAHRFGETTSRGREIPVRLSQGDLANWAGISRETLVRWFRLWRARGILDRRPRPLTILDWEGLRRAARPWGDEWSAPPDRIVPDRIVRDRTVPVRAAPARRAGVPAGIAASAAPPAARPLGRRLPPAPPFFTGRAVSLGKLDLLVAQREWPRAVVVQGMAGVGKTALALHWAHRAADRFPDGVVFAELRGTTPGPVTAAQAMGQVLRRAGVPGDQLPRTAAELAALCRSLLADKRILLILDDVADPGQIRPLLAAAASGLVVVTSRRRLPVLLDGADVRTLELRELGTQEAVDLIAGVVGRSDPRLRSEDRAVVRLARECGCLPLALSVMAGRLAEDPGASVAGVVRKLADRGAGPTFDVAYRGLRRDLRRAFRRLGLTPGPDVTPAALAALLDGTPEEAAACLAALRQASLVDDAGPGRYRMHGLLRDFAREQGLREDADSDRLAARRRLLAAYLAAARTAGPAWFEAERRTLVAAVEQAARLGLHRTCWELAGALFGSAEFRRNSEDVIAVCLAGLRAARSEDDWGAVAVMLHDLAVAHFEQGNSVQAIGYGEDARRAFRAADPPDPRGEAVVLATLADVHTALGRYPTAIDHARRALEIHRELVDVAGVARDHDILARAHLGLGADEPALRHARRALDVRRRSGDRRGAAGTLLTLARIHRNRGNVHEALTNALEALSQRQEVADRHGAAEALTELARMNAALGLRDLARRDAERALHDYRALGARHGEARALTVLGMLMCDATRFAEAFTHCGEALRLHRDTGDRQGEAEALAQTGIVHWRLGRYHEARELLTRALEIRREIGDRQGEAHDLEHLSVVMRRLGRPQEAFVLGLEALDLWHHLGARSGMAGTLGSLARTYLRLGLPGDAEVAARQALRIREAGGDWYGMGVGMDTFAAVLRRSGRPGEALAMELESLRLLRDVGDRHGEGTALVHLADIHLDLGRPEEALETGRAALDLAAELGDAREQACALHTMARAAQLLGGHARAARHLGDEIKIRRDMDDHRGLRRSLELRRRSHLALGDHAAAADDARRARSLDQWLDSG